MTHLLFPRCLVSVSLSLSLLACQSEPMPSSSDGSLRIEQHDATVVRGSFLANGVTIGFVAEMPRDAAATVDVRLGDDTLRMSADAVAGEVRFVAEGATLSGAERDALGGLSVALDGYLGGADDPSVMHEGLLVSASAYFAAAPVDVALRDAFHIVEPLGGFKGALGSDGKQCIKPGQVRTAYFDGSNGNHAESWTVGANGGNQWNGDFACMGRCGAGCGSYDWTLDCLEHDACSRRYYSSTGPIDHNCGDEYSDAADDYAAFWHRCYN